MKRFLVALCALAILSGPSGAAEVVSGATPGSGKPPSVVPGGSWNGSTTIIQPGDSDGNPYVRLIDPSWGTPIQSFTNRTIAAAAVDTVAAPFPTTGYSQVWALFRIRTATIAAAASCEFAVRGHFSATLDSTQGWWFPKFGLGSLRNGKTIPVTNFATDRLQVVPLCDSLLGNFYKAPYMSTYFKNNTGNPVIYDLWFFGVH